MSPGRHFRDKGVGLSFDHVGSSDLSHPDPEYSANSVSRNANFLSRQPPAVKIEKDASQRRIPG